MSLLHTRISFSSSLSNHRTQNYKCRLDFGNNRRTDKSIYPALLLIHHLTCFRSSVPVKQPDYCIACLSVFSGVLLTITMIIGEGSYEYPFMFFLGTPQHTATCSTRENLPRCIYFIEYYVGFLRGHPSSLKIVYSDSHASTCNLE